MGDVRALNEFREWYDSKDVDEANDANDTNDSDGGAVVDGGGFGDGREERYADGETDSTDGGAHLH